MRLRARHYRSWHRRLWGVVLMRRDGPLGPLGASWDERHRQQEMAHAGYVGEPTRPLLFTTRRAARLWCAEQQARDQARSDGYTPGRFVPVRVSERVEILP